ncbi:MAG TPA: methionyl-tRNA formyltransferase [Candidatus Saccharimonadales bacterium]
MKPSKKLVFFGNERLSSGYDAANAPILTSLIEAGYPVVAVVANYEPGRSRKHRELEVAIVAKKYNIPLFLPHHPREITADLRDLQAEAGVLAAYGKIVPQETIDVFPCGIINIHPSLLPKYRGPIPIEQAILDGAAQTGVSIMRLVKQMDAGPVYVQASLSLAGNESKEQLTRSLAALGQKLLLQHLPNILSGEIRPQPQDETEATYCGLIKKDDGIINWQKPAVQLQREIRAYLGWPGSRTSLFGQDILLLEAHIRPLELPLGKAQKSSEGILVGCSEQSLLITKLRPNGRSSMSASDFLRGLRTSA